MSVNIQVYIEDSGELMQLKLSSENAKKASIDPVYLQQLVNEELSKRSEQLIAQVVEEQSSPAQSGHEDVVAAETDSGNDKSLFIWTPKCIDLFLALYEENMENFESGSQRHNKIWIKISSAMKAKGYNVTWAQCQSKLNGLKRTYKKIIDHNNVSGNDKKNWLHFEVVPEKWLDRLLEVSQSKKYNKIEDFVDEFMLEGYASSQVIEQLNDTIIRSDSFTDKQKICIGEKLGECSYRLLEGGSEYLQLINLCCGIIQAHALK